MDMNMLKFHGSYPWGALDTGNNASLPNAMLKKQVTIPSFPFQQLATMESNFDFNDDFTLGSKKDLLSTIVNITVSPPICRDPLRYGWFTYFLQ